MLDPGSLARRQWKKRLYLALFERHLLQAAHGMLYTANDEKSAVEALLAKMPQGHTVALGADLFPISDRDRLRAEFLGKNPSLSQRPRLLHLGRIHEVKAVDRTIASLVEVRRKIPDVVFMLAGNGKPEYVRSLSRQAAELGLKDSVVFLGFVEGKAKHEALAAADLLVLPSHHENFGIAIAEAMQAGLPVVISRNVSLWQEVSAAGAGAIVSSAVEPKEIASEILRLLCDPAKLAQAGAAALDLASRSYSWETAARNTAQVYHDTLRDWTQKDHP
jgi:glycosyltransferase involved in cell wall biosynthesis